MCSILLFGMAWCPVQGRPPVRCTASRAAPGRHGRRGGDGGGAGALQGLPASRRAIDTMDSLLSIALRALARYLAYAPSELLPSLLAAVHRLEQAPALWAAWQDVLARAISPPPGLAPDGARPLPPPPLPARQQAVLEAFGAACWRPQLLRLAYGPGPIPPGLASLPLVAQRLLHLELSAPGLTGLDALAAACPQLRCLSLRGCTHLGDASLSALGRCSSLRALDLSGLAALTDGAAFHVAHLPQLSALSLAGTAVSDRALQMLTYGHSVRAWAKAAGGAQLPPEAAAWPAPPLEHLQVRGLGLPGWTCLGRALLSALNDRAASERVRFAGLFVAPLPHGRAAASSLPAAGGHEGGRCRCCAAGAPAAPALSGHEGHGHRAGGAGAAAAPLRAALCAGSSELWVAVASGMGAPLVPLPHLGRAAARMAPAPHPVRAPSPAGSEQQQRGGSRGSQL